MKRSKRGKPFLKDCLWCSKEFIAYPSKVRAGRDRYCSQICGYLGRRKPRKCKECKRIFQEVSAPQLDFCSKECKMKGSFGNFIKHRYEGKVSPLKGRSRPDFSGPNHPNWLGGITLADKKLRNSLDYRLWREAVFKRDNWSCKFCGDRSRSDNYVYLEADHIKPWALYPELRFAIDNGRTLCKPCHKTTDTYGHKASQKFKSENK